MKAVDIRTVEPDSLVDITTIHIDEKLDKQKRIEEFLRQIKNPYCFKVGDMIVKTSYSKGATLTERFQDFVLAI